jgi:hypothetical protein
MMTPIESAALLKFVDTEVPPGCHSVWLAGSRANDTNRSDSDWDVLALHPDAADRDDEIFDKGTFYGEAPDGNRIELVVVRPWRLSGDSRRYFADCRQFGIRLR